MGGAASKAKGSQFERDICVKLSLWITNGKRRDVFWRSAMSGGRATVASKRGHDVRQAGDITAVAPEGHKLTDHVYIECKHYKDLQLESFILTGKGNLAKFWKIACSEAAKRHKQPWLIAKQNNLPTMLIVSHFYKIYGLDFTSYTIAEIHSIQCNIRIFEKAIRVINKRERLK